MKMGKFIRISEKKGHVDLRDLKSVIIGKSYEELSADWLSASMSLAATSIRLQEYKSVLESQDRETLKNFFFLYPKRSPGIDTISEWEFHIQSRMERYLTDLSELKQNERARPPAVKFWEGVHVGAGLVIILTMIFLGVIWLFFSPRDFISKISPLIFAVACLIYFIASIARGVVTKRASPKHLEKTLHS